MRDMLMRHCSEGRAPGDAASGISCLCREAGGGVVDWEIGFVDQGRVAQSCDHCEVIHPGLAARARKNIKAA